MPERVHLEALSSRRGFTHPDLIGPPFPAPLKYLWHWFIELNNARPSGGMGAGAITYPDIDAWARLTRRAPAPWEIEALKNLDLAWLASLSPAKSGPPKEDKQE